MKTNQCRCCKEVKVLSEFVKDKYTLSGYKNLCKQCQRDKSKEYHNNVPSEIKAKKMREWRGKNKDYHNAYLRHWRGNLDEFQPKERSGRTREEARKSLKENKKRYDTENKERLDERRKEYYSKEENKQNRRKRIKKWLNENPTAKIAQSLRRRLRNCLKEANVEKRNSFNDFLGCKIDEFVLYLESKFEEGMSWDNYGPYILGGDKKWNIDHILPCVSFDLENIEEQKKCFHYTNMQPLWGSDNYSKKDNISEKHGNESHIIEIDKPISHFLPLPCNPQK